MLTMSRPRTFSMAETECRADKSHTQPLPFSVITLPTYTKLTVARHPKLPEGRSKMAIILLWAEALVQWLKLSAWKVGDRGIEPCSGIQISKKQNASSLFTHNVLILWGNSVTMR